VNSREIVEKIEEQKTREREYLENIIQSVLVSIFYLASSGKGKKEIKLWILKNIVAVDNELLTRTAKEQIYKRALTITKGLTRFYEKLTIALKDKKQLETHKYLLNVHDSLENVNTEIIISAFIFGWLTKNGSFKYLIRGINKALNKDEEGRKKELLHALFLEGKFKDTNQLKIGNGIYQLPDKEEVFYLISKHMDCAKDHEMAQGKIYVDEKRKLRIDNREERKKIEELINSRGIKTLQSIISAPTYLLTRPNCRHYVQTIRLKNIVQTENKMIDYDKMLADYNMITNEGNRDDRQTPVYSIKNKASIRNVISIYSLRDKLYNKMYKKIPSQTILQAIVKNNILLKKWQSLI
jgi:hypothetical protein